MTYPKSGSARQRLARRAAFLMLLAGSIGLAAGQSTEAQHARRVPSGPAAPLTPAPYPTAPAGGAASAMPAATAGGMCQCIADHDRRHISCLSSVQECQSACATDKYSFVPNAPSCPATAEERGR